MVTGILGKKVGMTQIFDENGKRISVTVLEAGPCVVQSIKTVEKDGYVAVQLGFERVREKRVKKPQREDLKAKGLTCKRYVREIRCEDASSFKVGDEMTSDIFQKGDYLDIVGTSKGKGFQGGMKRRGWSGGGDTHGSMSHRAPGSIGASSFPSRVFKGHPGPGQMGNDRITVQNLKVVEIDSVSNTILVRGAVPGSNGSYLIVRFAKKKPVAPREVKEEILEETEAVPDAVSGTAEELVTQSNEPEGKDSQKKNDQETTKSEKTEETPNEEATKEGKEE
ncbi:MAG: 50S ribosomal protein L3 [Candidatus Omnitrophica bacterium]|nr:50S ribosomal protein L3 [Candidatus Omnitrophota bacterium]MBU1784269.1 50S ribosomal protein L3 [Candidatus Omnitrophota bacterium]MBU1851827.1 50S ribosomal protein L3 [Candidatus Omnitrophota bacterium]